MRSSRFLSLVAAGTFLVACDNTVTNINDEAKADATITLRIVDNHSGEALSGAKVYSVVDDDTETSDDLGLSVWDDCVLGDHAFKISKDGYATILTNVALEEQGQGNVARVGDEIVSVAMYKTGVSAKGVVLYTDDKGNLNAVKEAVVYAVLPARFYPSEISTKTDKNGEYVFEDLPEGVSITLYVGQMEIDSKIYTGADDVKEIGGVGYRAGDVVNVTHINLTKNASELVKISDNLKNIDSTTSLEFKFSAELLADSVSNTVWRVTNSSGELVLTTPSLSKDKKTVSIAPYSKKWNSGSAYTVSGTVYAKDGATRVVNGTFVIGGSGSSAAPKNVTNLAIELDEDDPDYAVLSWKAPKGDVYRYNIYYMTNVDADYTRLTYVGGSYTQYMIDVTDFESTVKTITFIVLPVNEDGIEADISDAKSVKFEL